MVEQGREVVITVIGGGPRVEPVSPVFDYIAGVPLTRESFNEIPPHSLVNPNRNRITEAAGSNSPGSLPGTVPTTILFGKIVPAAEPGGDITETDGETGELQDFVKVARVHRCPDESGDNADDDSILNIQCPVPRAPAGPSPDNAANTVVYAVSLSECELVFSVKHGITGVLSAHNDYKNGIAGPFERAPPLGWYPGDVIAYIPTTPSYQDEFDIHGSVVLGAVNGKPTLCLPLNP